jgi:hypothetical protein
VGKDSKTLAWDDREGHDGAGALSGEGTWSISQQAPVSNGGKYTCLAFVKIRGSKSKAGYLDVAILDGSGEPVDQHYRRKTLFLKPGVWTPIATTIDLSALKKSWPGTSKEPATMKLQLNISGLDPGDKAYVDDAGIYMQ